MAKGQRFGLLTVDSLARCSGYRTIWNVVCDCGHRKTARQDHLVSGRTKSCGCLVGYVSSALHITHGRSRTTEYSTWASMKQRCLDPNRDAYAGYGGRGIRVCDRWISSFEAFLADMGEKPSRRYSIERIDNDGNYEPGNCRWATKTEQARNRRPARFDGRDHPLARLITVGGVTDSLAGWAKRVGLTRRAIAHRLKKGWSEERAVTVGRHGSSRGAMQ